MKKSRRKSAEKKSKIGILGYGEVGQAIAKFYKNPRIKDLKRDDGLEGVDILHICIPWGDSFLKTAENEIKGINPQLAIVHSTVAPGTTKKLAKKFKGIVVHSPVRGIHPKLFEGIKTFVKYVGADNRKKGKQAQKHLESLGIKTKLFTPSMITETGKILDTTYYGLCIAWCGEMKKVCDKLGIDFEKTVKDMNETYNQGYTKLGKKHFVRPVLYPPEKGIGGHCVIPNAQILNKFFKSKAVDLVLSYKPKKSKK